MNTLSNAVPEAPLGSQVIAPAAISPSRRMYWSVRRELWENRSIYIAPLAVAGVFLFGFLISLVRLPDKMRHAFALDPVQQRSAIQQPYILAAGLLMLTAMIVGVFYCLDALYGERRDRSILFWKSLPVSDLTTVLSKASIPLIVLPLLTVAITITTHMIMLLLSSAVLQGSGLRVATVWTQLPLFRLSFILLYHLVIVHGLWHAPFYGWLLLVSSWAKRAAFLWALLPPLAIGIVEKIAFNSSHFADLLLYQLSGGGRMDAAQVPGSAPFDMLGQFEPGRLLSAPGLWIGLAFAAAFLAAAVRLRRYREPI
jgi:ABC-2 type transport system permease protein